MGGANAIKEADGLSVLTVRCQNVSATSLEPRTAPRLPAALPFLPCHLLTVCFPVLVPPFPAAGPPGHQVCPGAQVQAAAPKLRQLGLGA